MRKPEAMLVRAQRHAAAESPATASTLASRQSSATRTAVSTASAADAATVAVAAVNAALSAGNRVPFAAPASAAPSGNSGVSWRQQSRLHRDAQFQGVRTRRIPGAHMPAN